MDEEEYDNILINKIKDFKNHMLSTLLNHINELEDDEKDNNIKVLENRIKQELKED